MRPGRPDASLARPAREQHHRLAGPGRGTSEPATVAEVLEVDADHPRGLVLRELLDELGRLEVGLIADRDETGDAEADLLAEQRDLDRQVAALRDQAEMARDEVARGEVELGLAVVDPHAVRPDENGARGANALHDGLLSAAAVRGALPEAGGDRDDRPCARGQRAFDGLFERARRNREHHQLGRLRQLVEGAVRLLPEHGSARAVDQEDRASVRAEQG